MRAKRYIAHRLWFVATVFMGWLAGGHLASAAEFNTNLLFNGGAEASPGGNGYQFLPPDGWVNSGVTVARWAAGGGFPVATDPGPPDRGTNFFAGGNVNAMPFCEQAIDVANLATLIDAGEVRADLSAWLGGYAAQDDNAMITATFLAPPATNILDRLQIGPVLASDRAWVSGMLFRAGAKPVPAGTRQIVVRLTMTPLSGGYIDGYADNLSLVLVRTCAALAVIQEGANIVLSWPSTAPCELEVTASISAPLTWLRVTAGIADDGTRRRLIIPNAAFVGTQFYRLSGP